MVATKSSAPRISLGRLALVSIALVPLVWAALLAALWVQSHVASWVYWKAGLIVLFVVEFLFIAAGACGALGTPVCALHLLRSRGEGKSRARAARRLALCVSLLVSTAVAESFGAIWIQRVIHSSAVPVGGLAPHQQSSQLTARFAAPVENVDLPRAFPDPRGDRTIDVVVLGESSAAGVPFDGFLSIGKIVAWKLAETLAQRPIRLAVLARAGDTLERQQQALASLNRRPDLLIVYCGHNEFFSRLWWSRNIDYYVADQATRGWQSLLERVEQRSSFCRWIGANIAKCRIAIPPTENNSRDLIDVPVYTTAEYSSVLADFMRRLDQIAAYAESVGALAVLVLPPGNDAGFEPNRSFLSATTSRSDRELCRRDFLAARNNEAANPAASIAEYRRLVVEQPSFAEAHYRLARLLERAADWEGAYEHYVAARDLDGLPIRCTSDFQRAYRDVARRRDCILIDGQAYFHRIGRNGLLDDVLFQDAMHPSLRGQIALAQALLAALKTRGAFGWPNETPAPMIDPAECASHFKIDAAAWKDVCMLEQVFLVKAALLRYDPIERKQAANAFATAAEQIAGGISPDATGLLNVGVPAPVPAIAPDEIADHFPGSTSSAR